MALFDNVEIKQHDLKTELLKNLYSIDLYREIIESSLLNRLKNIHFLGAIDYLYTNKKKHTRYEHTLSVATLALHYSKIKNLAFKDEKYLVCAALLHDIGHGPLSHSMEPSFKKLFNITHHKVGMQIINGSSPLGKDIYNILSKHKININEIIKLLNGESKEEYAFALDNPINIDTIDGILRTYTYLSNSRNKNKRLTLLPNIYEILEATTNIKQLNILDEFWKLKDFVYSNIINDDIHMYADNFSQNFVLSEKRIKENDFYLTELQFKESYGELFNNFKSLKDRKNEKTFSIELNYIRRSYQIKSDIQINHSSEYFQKYVYTKIADVFRIDNKEKHIHQTFNLGY